jgi:KTSC domain
MTDTDPKFDAIITVHDSAFIQGLVYDFRTLTMDVQMKSGLYRYEGVVPLEFTMLVTSRSTGTTFNAVIKGQKTCTKLTRKSL